MAEENPNGFQIDIGADENVEDPGVGQGYVKLLLLQTILFHKLLLILTMTLQALWETKHLP